MVKRKKTKKTKKTPEEIDNRKFAFDAHLTEYNALRQDIFSRFEYQRQAFNFLIVILGAVISAIFVVSQNQIENAIILLLFLPIIVAPLGFIFFDNELMIYANAFYLFDYLGNRVSEIAKDDVFLFEEKRLKYMRKSTLTIHRLISTGRWILFVLPCITPIFLSFYYKNWFSFPYVLIFILDCLLTLLLLGAMLSALKEQSVWAKLARASKYGKE